MILPVPSFSFLISTNLFISSHFCPFMFLEFEFLTQGEFPYPQMLLQVYLIQLGVLPHSILMLHLFFPRKGFFFFNQLKCVNVHVLIFVVT